VFRKKFQIANLMNVRLVGAELMNADGRTDSQKEGRDEANSHFSQFCEHA
jgi:hypothetical protein